MTVHHARRAIELKFSTPDMLRHVDDPIQSDLSAATFSRGCLFLSCDETAGVDRLTEQDGHWGDHRHFNLGELLDLPDGPAGEMDIEGLCCDDDWLWVVGSHALKRKKPDAEDDGATNLAAMTAVTREANRYFLGRFPLSGADGDLRPVRRAGSRRAEHVRFGKTKSRLMRWLGKDPHLAPFLSLPSKENGLDIEGIAARGLRVWLGLRGPVLRGYAVILELEMKVTGKSGLKAKRIDGRRRYRKHLLPTRASASAISPSTATISWC
ncbi:DUF3616 domain-containing protein [Methylobrevis pamukkalensis]|uniref:DUF3616 domain-containing protein n=1 Tax=Methylobrevis pamukkalensis TaxID=1439726 RepID=A0A1E3H888_9HYPH|nr:DUF3616 domain-containing protein [Methylobrevis pamukkalensis]ODN72365.1 hypothetical protein A6302_00292 [Methylobrevis pamukkalensis]